MLISADANLPSSMESSHSKEERSVGDLTRYSSAGLISGSPFFSAR